MINLEVSAYTLYEDTKAMEYVEIGGGLGWLGVTEVISNITI